MKWRLRRHTALCVLLGLTGAAAEAQSPATLCVLAPSAVSVGFTRQFTLPELARQGFREGDNLRVVVREAGGQPAELPRLARELAAQRCDVVVAVAASSIQAARQAMPATPIVMGFGDDPVGWGWAASLQRPGFTLDVAEAARPEDFDRAFAALRRARAEALLVTASPIYLASVKDIVARAQSAGWGAVCEWQEMARAGCLAGFGPTISELRTRVGAIAAQVLRGTPPGEIPIEQPTRFELTLNLGAARALGLTIPQPLLLRADEVVD